MKGTENFKKVILGYLKNLAIADALFNETFKKANKNIEDCVIYILNQVKASGCNGFEDAEIFAMAVHYYDEDDIKPGSPIKAKVLVNHSSKKAEVMGTEKTKSIKKKVESPKVESNQVSIFDFL